MVGSGNPGNSSKSREPPIGSPIYGARTERERCSLIAETTIVEHKTANTSCELVIDDHAMIAFFGWETKTSKKYLQKLKQTVDEICCLIG
jgi:hypothetical protein